MCRVLTLPGASLRCLVLLLALTGAARAETLELCGEKHELKRFDPEAPLPSVTQAMSDEARNHPELSNEYVRNNACLKGGQLCAVNRERRGGEELNDELKDVDLAQKSQQAAFYGSVTQVMGARDTAAKVSQSVTFARFVVDYHLLYRVADHSKFHENAEGVNLVSKELVDEEAEEQEKLADILAAMKEKFERLRDRESALITAAYEEVAGSQAKTLKLVSCELQRMADFNREVENRLTGLVPMLKKENGGSAVLHAQGMTVHSSSISGTIDPEPKGRPLLSSAERSDEAAEPVEPRASSAMSSMPGLTPLTPDEEALLADGGASRKPASLGTGIGGWARLDQEALSVFGTYEEPPAQADTPVQAAKETLLWEGDWGTELFVRVHERYRQKDREGRFKTFP